MKFCPNCGTAEIEFKIPAGDSRNRYICGSCSIVHYENPKIVVGCIPVFEDKILLCRRDIQPQRGFWNIPAGFMENGETVEQGAIREVWEEAGAEVEIERLFAVFNIVPVNQVYMIFLAKMLKSEFYAGEESAEVRLFDPADIPFSDLAFESNRFALDKFLNHRDSGNVHLGTYKRTF